MPVPSQVIHILGRAGAKGVTRVRCKVVDEGKGRGKVLIRNVIGPVKLGDILMIPDAEIEAAGIIE